ncbi:5' nucleotidase, NT5C type [Haemophilus haemolyticus]|uniref:5' nucleotidase, NT5C type n=1 Tax=Haemophilus haemolyticus TaxID=726 RepID=UPI000E587A3A|nr:hypothetical protein [Haemophilus haemolyticus]
MKKIVYIDMDNVMVDFPSGIAKLDEKTKQEYEGRYDEVEGIFSLMDPMPNAISAVHKLMKKYHIYALSTAPWHNPSAWSDKVKWIQHYFSEEKGSALYKRLILSHHKNLNQGDYLIDDRTKNGAGKFQGEHVHFGTQYFQRLSDKPFLHIESYVYQPLYKAGNIFGMMARDRQIDEILEQKEPEK